MDSMKKIKILDNIQNSDEEIEWYFVEWFFTDKLKESYADELLELDRINRSGQAQ